MEFEIIENLGIISTNKYGWSRELNLVRFGNGEPMYDIREWSADHKEKGDGITLNKAEAQIVASMIVEKFFDEQKEQKPKQKKATIIDFKTREKKDTTEHIELPF